MASPKLTDELAAEICEHLRNGQYRKIAAQLVGIHEGTLAQWMARKYEPYKTFQTKVLAAEAESERASVAIVRDSPLTVDHKWYLARKFPDRWAETRRLDLSGRIETGLKLDANAISDPTAREHLLGLISYLADSDPQPSDAGENSDERGL